jgi:hypothetical protein
MTGLDNRPHACSGPHNASPVVTAVYGVLSEQTRRASVGVRRALREYRCGISRDAQPFAGLIMGSDGEQRHFPEVAIRLIRKAVADIAGMARPGRRRERITPRTSITTLVKLWNNDIYVLV